MFQNPFSFEGRIRRKEYGFTIIIYAVSLVVTQVLAATGNVFGSIMTLLLTIPVVWFLWAQGAKRCHDIDRSGWMQLIPFYPLFLLFEEGKPGSNEYGHNPKEDMQLDVIESDTLDGHLK
jgi:uncharacterized membrane protein YhaH (DUF805 family)